MKFEHGNKAYIAYVSSIYVVGSSYSVACSRDLRSRRRVQEETKPWAQLWNFKENSSSNCIAFENFWVESAP